jgi:thiamine biosynthesis protein ThiC
MRKWKNSAGPSAGAPTRSWTSPPAAISTQCRQAIIQNSTVPIGTVPIYSMIIGRTIEELNYDVILKELEKQAQQGVDYFTIHAGVLRSICRSCGGA